MFLDVWVPTLYILGYFTDSRVPINTMKGRGKRLGLVRKFRRWINQGILAVLPLDTWFDLEPIRGRPRRTIERLSVGWSDHRSKTLRKLAVKVTGAYRCYIFSVHAPIFKEINQQFLKGMPWCEEGQTLSSHIFWWLNLSLTSCRRP